MAVRTSEQLKEDFAEGKLVTNVGFEDMIDSCINDLKKLIHIKIYSNVDYEHVTVGTEDHEYAQLFHFFDSSEPDYDQYVPVLATEEQCNYLQSVADGSVVIITNEKPHPFYIRVLNYDNGPIINDGNNNSYPRIAGRDITTKDFVLSPCGSIAFVKLGSYLRQEGYWSDTNVTPTLSAVAMAVQGQIS